MFVAVCHSVPAGFSTQLPPLLLYLLSINIFAENRRLAQNGVLRACLPKKQVVLKDAIYVLT
jgi:hypothetical protein